MSTNNYQERKAISETANLMCWSPEGLLLMMRMELVIYLLLTSVRQPTLDKKKSNYSGRSKELWKKEYLQLF